MEFMPEMNYKIIQNLYINIQIFIESIYDLYKFYRGSTVYRVV